MTFYTQGSSFWLLRLLHGMVYKSLIRPWSLLGKLKMSCVQVFPTSNFVQNTIAYVNWHAHIIMCSRIWFELPDLEATVPHVTTKVAQNTRPSFLHMWEGLGTRLILGVNLTDAWYRFALWLPGLRPGSPTTHSFLPSFSSLECLGVSRTVPRLLALFLMVVQPLLHPKVHNRPAHSTLPSSNSDALLALALEKDNHGAQIRFAWASTVFLLVQVLICLAAAV